MTARDDKFTRQTITALQRHTPKLFSLRCTRDAAFRFRAGQFARLGVRTASGCVVWRAYSMVSAPHDDYLEFFSIQVPDGQFSSQLARLQVGDELLVERQAYGFLTLDRFSDGRDLWLLASGTGIAPFLSILQEPEVWQRFAQVRLLYSVRHAEEQVYRALLDALPGRDYLGIRAGQWQYLVTLTGEQQDGCLHGRLPGLLATGELERAAGLALQPEHSRLMVCGNPQMIEDTRESLRQRGLQLALTRRPGQVAVENYW